MKKLLVGGLLLLTGASGCSGMNNTDRGLLTGGALGAGAGALIGGATGHAGAGALIGAGAGSIIGAVAGNDQDKHDQRQAQAVAYANQHPPLAITDVVSMVQQHISDDVIINQMNATGSSYNLTSSDITWLKQQGVSDRVVMAMQTRRSAVVAQQRPVVVYEEAPPVAVGVGFGYGYGPRYRRW